MKNDNEAPLPKIFPKLMHNFSKSFSNVIIKYWVVFWDYQKCQKVHFFCHQSGRRGYIVHESAPTQSWIFDDAESRERRRTCSSKSRHSLRSSSPRPSWELLQFLAAWKALKSSSFSCRQYSMHSSLCFHHGWYITRALDTQCSKALLCM